jgi:hypothetical protein
MTLHDAAKRIHVVGWIPGTSQRGKVVKSSPRRRVEVPGNCNQPIDIATFARHQSRNGATAGVAHQRQMSCPKSLSQRFDCHISCFNYIRREARLRPIATATVAGHRIDVLAGATQIRSNSFRLSQRQAQCDRIGWGWVA